MNRFPLNRLWFQFSLIISMVVVIAAVTLITVSYASSPGPPTLLPWRTAPTQPPPESEERERLSEDDRQALFRQRLQDILTRTFLIIALSGTVLGIAASVWMARRLTAPLEELAQGAQAVGSRNLSYRVREQGSHEVRSLARSFNKMAQDLDAAETMRRNLLTDVAHELRTPLTVLQGNLRAILDDVYALDKAEVAHLYDQTRHLIGLVNDLHALAQAETSQLSLDVQRMDIVELVEMSTGVFEPVADLEGVKMVVELPDEPIMGLVDRGRTTEVLQNLLSNALRHTPPGGTITVRTTRSNGTVTITVADTGDGIDPEHLPLIFDRFYRTDPARSRDSGGAGLGLAIVRAMVEAHGGTVRAESAGRGRGSTFIIELPV